MLAESYKNWTIQKNIYMYNENKVSSLKHDIRKLSLIKLSVASGSLARLLEDSQVVAATLLAS